MELLRLEGLEEGRFLERINRFAGRMILDGKEVDIHIRDSGRLGELLKKGVPVLVRKKEGGKLPYELVAVFRSPHGWVLTNSGLHSQIAEKIIVEGLLPEFRDVRGYGKEVKMGNSRIDFALVYDDGAVPLEVKGCTLFEGDVALFPDAPTERGRRHVEEISKYPRSMIMFLTMSDAVNVFSPHLQRDPAFTHALISSLRRKTHVLLPTLSFDGETLRLRSRVPLLFPITPDTRFILNVLREGEHLYNESFAPESRVEIISLVVDEKPFFTALFHGYLCVSCGLHDYFEDLSLILRDIGIRSRPAEYFSLGNSFVVRYDLTF
ncbi:MAG: DNA/RNA nuclease SfsA [Candidatus Diapherotrites archaeon]|nr:DNA/RNA nuclease SfsA [Candidatus Diapherotrites archaeon]